MKPDSEGKLRVHSIRFDESLQINGLTLHYEHPGDMAIVDDILFVSLDTKLGSATETGAIALFDLHDDPNDPNDGPESPRLINALPLNHKIDNLAVTAWGDDAYLIWVNGDGSYITKFYTTSTSGLRAPRCVAFEPPSRAAHESCDWLERALSPSGEKKDAAAAPIRHVQASSTSAWHECCFDPVGGWPRGADSRSLHVPRCGSVCSEEGHEMAGRGEESPPEGIETSEAAWKRVRYEHRKIVALATNLGEARRPERILEIASELGGILPGHFSEAEGPRGFFEEIRMLRPDMDPGSAGSTSSTGRS